jgi:hypothetical protein
MKAKPCNKNGRLPVVTKIRAEIKHGFMYPNKLLFDPLAHPSLVEK